MIARTDDELCFSDRLLSFEGLWDDAQATANQLAAIGHVSDRPPLESLEEGSRCITCSHFVAKETSKLFLEGDVDPRKFDTLVVPDFHKANCVRLQARLPFDTPKWFVDSASSSIKNRIKLFDERIISTSTEPRGQAEDEAKTNLLSLPIEIRLQIYGLVIPPLDEVVNIVQVDRDSMRITTAEALSRARAHDPTQSSILRVCLTTHFEVLDMIYSHTTFHFGSSKVLYMFLRRIGERGRSLLRSVVVNCGQREDAMAFALLASCEALERIDVQLHRAMLMPPRAPLWVQDGVHCLLSLRGLRQVDLITTAQEEAEVESQAAFVRQELTRPHGAPNQITTVDGVLVL